MDISASTYDARIPPSTPHLTPATTSSNTIRTRSAYPRPKTDLARNEDPSNSDLPERDLLTRYRHVYAGRGGMYRPSTSSSSQGGPLYSHLDRYKKDLLLKLTRNVYRKTMKSAQEITRSEHTLNERTEDLTLDKERVQSAMGKVTGSCPPSNKVSGEKVKSEEDNSKVHKLRDKQSSRAERAIKSQDNGPISGVSDEPKRPPSTIVPADKSKQHDKYRKVKSQARRGSCLEERTCEKQVNECVGEQKTRDGEVEFNELTDKRHRPVTAFSRLDPDKGDPDCGNASIVRCSNNTSLCPDLVHCDDGKFESKSIHENEPGLRSAEKAFKSGRSQDQHLEYDLDKSSTPRELSRNPKEKVSKKVKIESQNNFTSEKSQPQKQFSKRKRTKSTAAVTNSPSPLKSTSESDLKLLKLRLLKERSFVLVANNMKTQSVVNDLNYLTLPRKVRVKPMSEEALKAIEETKQEMHQHMKSESTDEGMENNLGNISSGSNYTDNIKECCDELVSSRDEGICSSNCSNDSEHVEADRLSNLSEDDLVENSVPTARTDNPHENGYKKGKPLLIEPLVSQDANFKSKPTASSLKKQMRKIRETCKLQQKGVCLKLGQELSRKYPQVPVTYVNQIVEDEEETDAKGGVRPLNVRLRPDKQRYVYGESSKDSFNRYSKYLSSPVTGNGSGAALVARKVKSVSHFSESAFHSSDMPPSPETYSPRVTLEDLYRLGRTTAQGTVNLEHAVLHSTLSNSEQPLSSRSQPNISTRAEEADMFTLPRLAHIGKLTYDSPHRKSRMAREKSFKITPMGYDARYVELHVKEEYEEEEVPEELRIRAVNKCSQWLQKYT